MPFLSLIGNALMAVACSVLANKLEPRLTKITQRRKKEKSHTSPK